MFGRPFCGLLFYGERFFGWRFSLLNRRCRSCRRIGLLGIFTSAFIYYLALYSIAVRRV